MSLEKTAPEAIEKMLQPLRDDGFTFACHPGVPCFTECCRELKLQLTPYDILRLKNHLKLDSGAFLDAYTDTGVDEQRDLPAIYLKMDENERRTCPFVSPEGCRVYPDRPAACRTYPIARASRMHRLHGTVLEDYFVLHEEHCRGFETGKTWTMEEWIGDQGLEAYTEPNNLWMELITHPKLRGGAALTTKQHQMLYLAAYNLDKFREFVFQSRFLRLLEITDEEIEALRSQDEALLRMAFKWLRFSLCGEQTLTIRSTL